MIAAPFQLVTLMEILELKAEPFWRLSSLIGQLLVRLETSFPPPDLVSPALHELRQLAERLAIRGAVSQIERINEAVRVRLRMIVLELSA
jgi:hypothetical protein